MPFLTTPDERIYAQATHPWDGLAATLVAGDAMRHINANLPTTDELLDSKGKTGSRSPNEKQGGRRGAAFTLTYPMMGSGAAGTPPDCSPVLECAFGQAPVIVPATSVTYSLADPVPGLTIASYRDPASADTWDRILFGGILQQLRWSSSEDEAEMEATGIAVYIVNRPNFANLDAGAKGGLATFPDEPVGGTYNGIAARGFDGAITLNGVGTYKLADFSVSFGTSQDARSSFGSDYIDVPSQGVRVPTLDIGIFEENTSELNDLRSLGFEKTPFDGIVTLGKNPGNIWTFNINGMQLPAEALDDSGTEYVVRWAGVPPSASSPGAKDEIDLVTT